MKTKKCTGKVITQPNNIIYFTIQADDKHQMFKTDSSITQPDDNPARGKLKIRRIYIC
jgi:hypothetical protein